MRDSKTWVLVLLVTTVAAAAPVAGQPTPTRVNVLKDCWTTSLAARPQPEAEAYSFPTTTGGTIDFVWQHKILTACSAYVANLYAFPCVDGNPQLDMVPFYDSGPIQFGPISPVVGTPNLYFSLAVPVTTFPEGSYDWTVVTECDDTDGQVMAPDGDVDDICGVNMGVEPIIAGPVIFGPEPVQFLDPDPGSDPLGRALGEDGSTRPWCFETTPAP